MIQSGKLTTIDSTGEPTNVPIKNVRILFEQNNSIKVQTTTNELGDYRVDVPIGKYTVKIAIGDITNLQRAGQLFELKTGDGSSAFHEWLYGESGSIDDALLEQFKQIAIYAENSAQAAQQIQQDLVNKGYYNPENTRKDKNNVLHATTGTPKDTLLVGDLNLGVSIIQSKVFTDDDWFKLKTGERYFISRGSVHLPTNNWYHLTVLSARNVDGGVDFIMKANGARDYYLGYTVIATKSVILNKIYTDANVTVDSNGFIKKASPIIRLFNDHIEHNEQFKEEPVFEKINVGTYKISNTSGLAKDGWTYEKPRGSDGNPYFRIKVEKLEDGCIVSVHDEYESFEKAEIIDAEGNKRVINKVVRILGQKRDIKEHERWIDLRFHEEIEEYEEQEIIE